VSPRARITSRLAAAPVLPVAAAFVAGLAATPWAPVSSAWFLGVALALLGAGALALCLRASGTASALLLLAVVALGVLRGAPSPPAPEHLIRQSLSPRTSVEGVLVEEPIQWTPDRSRLLLDVDALVEPDGRRPAVGRVQATIYGETAPLTEGQRIAAQLTLHRPIPFRNPGAFDYPAYLRREGILLVGNGRGDRVTPLSPEAPPWPVRVKRWAVATIGGQLPEGSAALLAGLVLGERRGLPRETDEAFRRAGVYHVLAVSGFNVGLLASSVFLVLTLTRLPRRVTAVVAGAVLIAFASIVGGQPSVVRATIMGLALLVGVLIDRESQLLNALSLAGLAVLAWRPGDLWDPGFLLSFAATAGIVHLAPALTAALGHAGCPRLLAVSLAVSLAAQAAVTPVMLVHFNQLSLAGVVANLAVVPLSAAATTFGLLALAVALVSHLASSALFNFVWLVLVLMKVSVWAVACLPWAMVHLPAPDWPGMVAWYAAAALVPWLGAGRAVRSAVTALALVVMALALWPWVRPSDGRLRVTFLDVGQGDAAFVELPGGERLLVDGGPGGPGRVDVGERILSPFLWNRPVTRLDAVVVSHSDPDHSGGLAAVARSFRVGEFWENGLWGKGTDETLRAIAASRAPRRVLVSGQRIRMGSALVSVLHPAATRTADEAGQELEIDARSENDASIVLRVDWRGVSLLFTGDISWRAEQEIVARGPPGPVAILKVAHHGSRFGSSEPFLAAVRPALAVISVGARNPFQHPRPETLGRLEAAGARVFRTDRDGAVIVESDGATVWVTRWATRTTERIVLPAEGPPM
jgi:competence protein ComEC